MWVMGFREYSLHMGDEVHENSINVGVGVQGEQSPYKWNDTTL